MRLQNVATRDWDLKGTVERLRYADDGRVVSYYIMTDRNHLTTRHRRFLKPLHADHDPKLIANKNIDTENYKTNIADLPNVKSVPRRSGRLSKTKSIKCITMGSELSNFSTPFTANIEISFGEEDVVTVREVRRNVQSNTANRQGQHGDQGVGRQAGEGARQEHAGQQAGVTRAVGGMANGGSQKDLGGATSADLAIPGCSSDGSQNNERLARDKNVTFFKAGNCYKAGCYKWSIVGKRRHNAITGSSTPALARGSKAGKRSITETITLDKSDSSDSDESLQEMEEKLARMLEMKFKRRRGPDSMK